MDWDSPTTKKHISESKAQGCELLGPGSNNRCRTYRLKCGHEQSIETRNMRTGQFKCQACYDETLRAEAEAVNCVFLGRGRNKNYRNYRLPCGHEQEIQPSSLRINKFRCQTCLNEKLEAEAEEQNCVLLGAGKTVYFRRYRLPCGHEQEIGTPEMRKGAGQFQCQTCLDDKHNSEAAKRGCQIVGKGKDFLYRTYRLACGHEQEITLGNMRLGNFRCHVCEDYFYTQPSYAYLLHIKVDSDEWLKMGYAKDIDSRSSLYGLPLDATVSILTSLLFDTGREARQFEHALHKKHRRNRLKASDMSDFHSKSGQTECYPVTMVDRLLAEFRRE